MNSKLNKIFFFSFVALWLLVVVVNLATPYRSYSENENRYLSAFPNFSWPELFDGRFMSKAEVYINDQFLLRDTWISIQSLLEYGLGKKENNNVYIGKNVLIGKLDEPNTEYVAANIAGINHFAAVTHLPASVMIVPSASEILKEKLPPFAVTWPQGETIDGIYGALAGVRGIWLPEILHESRDRYIYYRTDHHWTTYGAYLAYTQFCAVNHLSPAPYNAQTVSTAFNGTLYSSSGVRFVQSDVIEAFVNSIQARCEIFDGKETKSYDGIYFPEYLEKKDKYAYFLGTNQPMVTLYGSGGQGKKLVVFKDSYAHALAPMLLEHYDTVALVDLRYINRGLEAYLDLEDYDEALFLFSIDTFVHQKDVAKLTYLIKSAGENAG